MPALSSKLVLLTGATGYVGGRLLPLLVEAGWRVRCLARRPDHLLPRVPAGVELVQGDLLNAASLSGAMSGVEAAFYLVHSMSATGDFEAQDRLAADNFAAAAHAAGVQRIVYLGGLGEDKPDLSAHLRSRHEVGERLRAYGVPVIEFRASIIIGSGSLSFEMIRALVERLPVMLTPRWVNVAAQPIAIGDVLAYLLEALTLKTSAHAVFEIGGPDRVSYGDLMREYARQRSLRRLMIAARFQATCLFAAAAWICFTLTVNADATPERTLFDFATATNATAWQIVNDDVMGGVFISSFRVTNGVAVFCGEVSLENNGGFASVRSSPVRQNLAGYDAFIVRVRGDGRRYKFTVRTESGFDTPIYQCAFTTRREEWEEHRLEFKDFIPTFRGHVLTDVPALDPARVVSVGFLISDKQERPFKLEVAWIKTSPRTEK